MGELVFVRKDKHIAYLTMNRPEKLNALSADLVQALIRELKKAEADDEVKVIILSGAGKSFCSGGDLSAFQKMSDIGSIINWMKEATRLEQTIVELPEFDSG